MQELSKEERLQQIIGIVLKSQRVDMKSLSEKFCVSVDTIRRDIRELHDKGMITSIRGGAIQHSPIPNAFHDRSQFDILEKEQIALKAVSQVQSGQIILLGGGTSTLALAMKLAPNMQLTVLTNSFPIANVINAHPNIELIFAGGRSSKNDLCTRGYEAAQTFHHIRADICFISAYSIDIKTGITTKDYENAMIERLLIQNSGRRIALATANKLSTSEPHFVCDITELDVIITELAADDIRLKPYQQLGIHIF